MGELPSPPNTLFGVPLSLTDAAASDLRSYLEECWRTTAGAPPGDLTNDLALLDKFFNPIHVGRSVRDALQGVKPSLKSAHDAPFVDQLVILTQDRRRLITP